MPDTGGLQADEGQELTPLTPGPTKGILTLRASRNAGAPSSRQGARARGASLGDPTGRQGPIT